MFANISVAQNTAIFYTIALQSRKRHRYNCVHCNYRRTT